MMSEEKTGNDTTRQDIEQILYGHGNIDGVTGLDVDGGGAAVLFQRIGDSVEQRTLKHYFFFILSEEKYAEGLDSDETVLLDGDGFYRHSYYFPSRGKLWKACGDVIRNYNRINGTDFKHNELYRIHDLLHIPDSETQFLIQSGVGQFLGMDFSGLRRMQIAVAAETPWEPEHTLASDEQNRILCIALSDNTGWWHIMHAGEQLESDMLEELCRVVAERDPDVIEGHNLYRFIFPLLAVKFRKYKIEFKLGRRMYGVEHYETNREVDGKRIPFKNFTVPGRHVIDTSFLATNQNSRLSPDIDELDPCAVANALIETEEYPLSPKEYSPYARATNLERVIEETLRRAEATASISEILLPAEFHQARMVPIPLGKLCMSGQARKIDLMMIRAYLHAGRAIPRPPQPEPFEGGYNELFISGKCPNAARVDVAAQYPSIMIGERIAPASDFLGVFLPILERLSKMRTEAKNAMDSGPGEELRRHDHLQKALKILCNSFYGMLGYKHAHFADFDAAARVTAKGREILKTMIAALEKTGCPPIQADTDGCYFMLPDDLREADTQFAEIHIAMKEMLPDYLDVSIEGPWPGMLSLKKKNYALLEKDGGISITGGILKSKSDERFVRRALEKTAKHILTDDLSGLQEYIHSLRSDITERHLPFSDICSFETITTSKKEYLEKKQSGTGRKQIYERMLWHQGDRALYMGGRISYYHHDKTDTVDESGVEFSWYFDPERPDYDVSHYLGRLDGALRRLQRLFTPEQYELLFEKTASETARRAARKISVGSTVVVKTASGDLCRYVELSAGYKKGKGVKRNVFVKSDDADAVREFRKKYSDTDVYRSTYEYLCDRPPAKGLARFCPKRGDLVIELENETGEQLENVAGALEAARHCAGVIERTLAIPRDTISYFYNGGKSFYLIVPQCALGLPDCVELNVIYERVARHVRDNMDEKHRGMLDMNLYNHDRPLRIPGTAHPKYGLYNTRLTNDEFFNLDPDKIVRLARFPREAASGELRFEDSATTHAIINELIKDIPRTEHFDAASSPPRINMRKKNWHKNIMSYLRQRGVTVRIPCVETLAALIQTGGHTGFYGRAKLITELRAAGKSEADIIRIFMDSPHFHEKYFDDIVLTDNRPDSERNETGCMLRRDIWENYETISCSNCQEWCSPGECYRNAKAPLFNEDESPEFEEFQAAAQADIENALSEIVGLDFNTGGFFKLNMIEAPMASGKTYQAVKTAINLANEGKKSLLLAPNHTACREMTDMASGMGHLAPHRRLAHLVGKNENSCSDISAMVGPCASCRCGVKAFQKKKPEFIDKFLSEHDGVFSLDRMKALVSGINQKLGKNTICLRTLSMLIAPRADIIIAPFIFFIERNLRGIFDPLPHYFFVDEADLFADQLNAYCHRSITVALPRTTASGCMRFCRKPRCNHCKLSYSALCVDGNMEPRARAAESSLFDDPADFIGALEDAAKTVRDEIRRGVVRGKLFDMDAVQENIERLKTLLKTKKHYLKPDESRISVEDHLRRENAALCESPGGIHVVVETGPIFGCEKEIMRYPALKFMKALIAPEEVQYDEAAPDGDEEAAERFRFSVSNIYVDREAYGFYKDGDAVYRNNINVFIRFLEFCENAPDGGALLRHIPRNGENEAACRIALSYLDVEYFEEIVFMLRIRSAIMMSGTFIEPRMAAAALLICEDEVNYFKSSARMHNRCTLVLHNSGLGDVYMAGDTRDNPVKPKALNHDSFFTFFNRCVDIAGDSLNLYYFAKNKNAAKSLYDSYKRNVGAMRFKAKLADSHNNLISCAEDEALFHSQASEETRMHLERASLMFVDNYRSARARGKNLPDFHLSIADGNGRANFDPFFD
ncbi:MAG: DNA polymerase domain-containing protein, partial [bacterium]